MGRPPGSKNSSQMAGKKAANGAREAPRKAERKQAAAPPAETRSNQPTPEENAGWLAELKRLDTEKQRIAGELSALSTRVKAKGGVKRWKSIKQVSALKALDLSEAIELLSDLVQVAAQQEIRISWMGNQASLTDILDQNQPPAKNTTGSRDLAAARAHSDGFNSGRNGALPHDNPFNPGTEEYVSWHDGRDEGAAGVVARKPERSARVAAAAGADATLPDDATADQPIF